MGVRRYEELQCWQLARALKKEAYAVTDRLPAKRDFNFCDQLRASARSAPSNIAEGFGRFRPTEFAHFLQIAKASLVETHNHLQDGLDLGYLSEHEWVALKSLAERSIGATTKLIVYLRGCDGSRFR